MTRVRWAMAAGALVLVIALAWTFDPFGRRERAERRAAVAAALAGINSTTLGSLDRYAVRARVLDNQAREVRHAVAASPQAEVALDADYRTLVCQSVERLRGQPACTPD